MPHHYQLVTQDSSTEARHGLFQTRRGEVELPLFCPVATHGSVKSLEALELKNLGVQMILTNAYHLHLRPGDELVQEQGGLHHFMKCSLPILTDSGGYQVFSLSSINKIANEGVTFRNHLNGDLIFMTPEKSIQIQWNLGADIIMAFDHCPLGNTSKKETAEAMSRTHLWLQKSYQKFQELKESSLMESLPHQQIPLFFGIVQGGVHEDLREESLAQIESLDLSGIAVGGMSVGEDKEKMYKILRFIGKKLPSHKPRYLMGVGTPADLIYAVDCGFDFFDCVLPTRLARSGSLWTWEGIIKIRNHQYLKDSSPLSASCSCHTCRNYSRSYLRHLFLSRELLSYRLNTIHNIYFYMDLMKQIRESIQKGSWVQFRDQWLQIFSKAVE